MNSVFEHLEDVIQDDLFPEVDLALRRGRHIGREDDELYTFLADAMPFLEPLYHRYGAELIRKSDGYFYLLPAGDRLGRRHLSRGEMLVGQALALLYLDPANLRTGTVPTERLLQRLDGVVGGQRLSRSLSPRRRKHDGRVAAQMVREKVATALRRLERLGFVERDGDHLRLRPALMRFAEPVRAAEDPHAALERLVARGELVDTRVDDEAQPNEEDTP